mmetsp:Transcript_14424/g.39418  ORF Transcript_14424/g.39418 Transcript_14424/m.39418 type:complete len:121 (+) Transcript_14424:1499-1861(+)
MVASKVRSRHLAGKIVSKNASSKKVDKTRTTFIFLDLASHAILAPVENGSTMTMARFEELLQVSTMPDTLARSVVVSVVRFPCLCVQVDEMLCVRASIISDALQHMAENNQAQTPWTEMA